MLKAVINIVVKHGGRVLLSGDHYQLPEVTAGGGFAALANMSGLTVAELSVNRRQHHPWEQTALSELRNGNVAEAVAAYRDHGRVEIATDYETMIATAVEKWIAATGNGSRPVLLATTNVVVDQLNLAVREQLKDYPRDLERDVHGLGEHLGTWNHKDIAVGERIVLRINDYQQPTPLLNGHTATVTATSTNGSLTGRLDHNNTDVQLSGEYLDRGGFDYAYGLTAHRAQGGTWDLAITVGADGLYREAGYLTMSRGRSENWLILTETQADSIGTELERHDSPLPLPSEQRDDDLRLVDLLSSSRSKTLATVQDPHAALISRLADGVELRTLEGFAAHARSVEHDARAIIGSTPATLRSDTERACRTGTHIAIGQIVKPSDRRNVGTVQTINDHDGTANISFVSTSGRTARRTFRWDQIDIIEPRQPEPRLVGPEAEGVLKRIVGGHVKCVERFNAQLASHNVAPDDAAIYTAAVRVHIERVAQRLNAARPEWLLETVGDRPSTPAGAQVWDDTVREIAGYRSRHHVTQTTTALGPRPATPLPEWDTVQGSITAAQTWLTNETGRDIAAIGERTPAELAERHAELDRALSDAYQLDNAPADLSADRSTWSHDHWPQSVEQTQITKALDSTAVEDVWYDGLGL